MVPAPLKTVPTLVWVSGRMNWSSRWCIAVSPTDRGRRTQSIHKRRPSARTGLTVAALTVAGLTVQCRCIGRNGAPTRGDVRRKVRVTADPAAGLRRPSAHVEVENDVDADGDRLSLPHRRL